MAAAPNSVTSVYIYCFSDSALATTKQTWRTWRVAIPIKSEAFSWFISPQWWVELPSNMNIAKTITELICIFHNSFSK